MIHVSLMMHILRLIIQCITASLDFGCIPKNQARARFLLQLQVGSHGIPAVSAHHGCGFHVAVRQESPGHVQDRDPETTRSGGLGEALQDETQDESC